MTQIQGVWWPDDVGTKWQHAFRHVQSLEWTLKRCKQRRTAVQAGGNIGLWPRRMAEWFTRVITFEPDAISRACLQQNVPPSVEVRDEALGERVSACDLSRKSLGSHRVQEGTALPMIALDVLQLVDVDLLQLDVEGYEWHALQGARETIARCHPLIQVELRGFTEKYGQTDEAVSTYLYGLGYRIVSKQPGSDVVFEWGRA